MKVVLPLAVAAILSLGSSGYALVPDFGLESRYEALTEPRAPESYYFGSQDHGHCVGLASGTAHHSCGTATGGPSGGLH